jgi:hypothetical protein
VGPLWPPSYFSSDLWKLPGKIRLQELVSSNSENISCDTYTWALLATVRGKGKIAVATATSGVAASIMPGGRTAHSRFKIPLNLEEGKSCSFTKQSGIGKLLRKASLILWDEATMTK